MVCACSQYGNYDDDDTASQGQASTPRGHTGGSSRNRVQFARRSTRGVGAPRRGVPASKGKDKQDPQDYMGKAKQLWNYVGKVRLRVHTLAQHVIRLATFQCMSPGNIMCLSAHTTKPRQFSICAMALLVVACVH